MLAGNATSVAVALFTTVFVRFDWRTSMNEIQKILASAARFIE
jgi:hypothetical protein